MGLPAIAAETRWTPECKHRKSCAANMPQCSCPCWVWVFRVVFFFYFALIFLPFSFKKVIVAFLF